MQINSYSTYGNFKTFKNSCVADTTKSSPFCLGDLPTLANSSHLFPVLHGGVLEFEKGCNPALDTGIISRLMPEHMPCSCGARSAAWLWRFVEASLVTSNALRGGTMDTTARKS